MDVVAYETTEPVVVFAANDVDRASATAMVGESVDLRLVDGVEGALEAADAAERLDCVITTADLADGTGIELLEAVQNDATDADETDGRGGDADRAIRGAHGTDVPAIYVPAAPSVADAEAATAAGATVYLPRDRAEAGELRERLADVVEGYDRRRQIARERELFDALLEHAPVPLYAKDRDARYVAASSYVGTGTEGSPLGRTTPEVLDDQQAALEHVREDHEIVETGEPILEQVGRSVSSDGEVTWHRSSKHPWRTPGGEIQGLVGVDRDVTAAKRREQELERQRWRLEQFASFTSTELREPITTAIAALDRAQAAMERAGGAQAGTDGLASGTDDTTAGTGDPAAGTDGPTAGAAPDEPALPDAADEALATVDVELERIQELIQTLLTMARPQAAAPEFDWVDLAGVVDQSWSSIEGATASLENRVDESLEVRADADLLRRCFEHLFRNALEQDAAGRDTTEKDTTEEGAASTPVERVEVRLTDSGITVETDGPPIELPDDPAVGAFEYQGAGYRVAIARDIVEAHDWSFDVESGTDGGVRFVVDDCLFRPAGLPAATAGEPIPLADSGDVGDPATTGEVTRDGDDWVLQGGGQNLWQDVCEFFAVWATVEGDARVEARVTAIDPAHEHSKAGVGFYDPADDAAPLSCIALDGTEGTESIGRPRAGEPIESHWPDADDGAGCHYRVDRIGDHTVLSTSPDGEDWTVVDHRQLQAPERVAAGLFVCSHSAERHTTATFEDVSVAPLEVSE